MPQTVLFEASQTSPVCPSGKSNVWVKMSVEHWWNDTDRGKQKCGTLVEWYRQGKTEVWSFGGMIQTGENRSVELWWNDIDRGKQKCGALVEWYRQEKTSVEHLWNDTDRGKQKHSVQNLPHCHFVSTDFTQTGLGSIFCAWICGKL
jgi:hypothetical protein